MKILKSLRLKSRAVLQRGSVESELNDEIRFHLEQEVAKNIRQGMDEAEARIRSDLDARPGGDRPTPLRVSRQGAFSRSQ